MSEPRPGDGIGIVFASFLSKAVVIGVCLLISLISIGPLSNKYSSVASYEHEIEVLNEQQWNAAELAAASAVASSAISMLPDDIGTPVSNQFAIISRNLVIVTGAVLLEKYLLTIVGYMFFTWLVPICMVAFMLGFVLKSDRPLRIVLLQAAIKALIFGLILWRAVPISVFVIDKINETYDLTITQAIESAKALSSESAEAEGTEESAEEGGFNLLSAAGETIDSLKRVTVGKANELVAWAKVALTQVTEGFAVLIITSCVIPILVPVTLFQLFKTLFPMAGANLPALPAPKKDFEVLSNGLIAPWSKRTAKQD